MLTLGFLQDGDLVSQVEDILLQEGPNVLRFFLLCFTGEVDVSTLSENPQSSPLVLLIMNIPVKKNSGLESKHLYKRKANSPKDRLPKWRTFPV